ncbi:hypothetical protein [Clostridium sp. Marseille-P299]|uniref:hypothetical protein n=1 Tax=Clostridium sp. Marseille-P299 TaxID=1805477 RepID=UPI0008302961|nr:hypothetical protein [Clostridium sp. Marseille-P299]
MELKNRTYNIGPEEYCYDVDMIYQGYANEAQMAEPYEVAYNRDKLIDCGANEEVAQEIAKTIEYMGKDK